MERGILKERARAQMQGKVGILAGITALYLLICWLSSYIAVLNLVLTPALSLAMLGIYLRLTDGAHPSVRELFAEFANFWSALKVMLLSGVFTFLWSLLLVIPGIVKAIGYSQALYILAENPNMGAREALRRSERMMVGHKMEYVMLQLSFLGWHILAGCTMGILYLWLLPYIMTTNTNFYLALKECAKEGY